MTTGVLSRIILSVVAGIATLIRIWQGHDDLDNYVFLMIFTWWIFGPADDNEE